MIVTGGGKILKRVPREPFWMEQVRGVG